MEEIRRARKVEGIHAARLGRVLEEPGIDLVNHKLSFVCVISTWEWLSELPNHTKQWLQCTIRLARYSYFQFTSPSALHQAM